MGFTRRLYDFLGKRLDASGSFAEDVIGASLKCSMMEDARHVGCSYIAAAISKSDINFYDAGERTKQQDAWLWNVSPNPNQSHTEFMEALVSKLFFHGDALVVPIRSRGNCNLYVADGFSEQVNSGKTNIFDNVTIEGTDFGDFTAGKVYYFRLNHDDGWLNLQRAVASQYSELGASAQAAFTARNSRKYKLKLANTDAGDATFRKDFDTYIKAQLQTFMENDNVIYPEFKGQSLEDFSTDTSKRSNPATDVVTLRKDMYELVATGYKMPVSMLYGNTNNFSTVFDSFLTFAVEPVAHMIGEEITRKTYDPVSWSAGSRAAVDTSNVKHNDLFDVADAADKLIAARLLSTNDALSRLGLDPIKEPWADDHLMTKNYDVVGGGNNDNQA